MSTTVQKLAMVFGVVFVLVGLLGFYYTGMNMQGMPDPSHYLLGIFPVNALHNVVHLLFGVWGIVASRSFGGSVAYAKIAGIIYLVLAICGVFMTSLLGLIPIGGADVYLHAVLGIALAAIGFTAKPTPVGVPAT